MRILSIAALLLLAACTGGGSGETTKTVTDTTIAPAKATDTTVVQKKVDVNVDTVKKTRHKNP